MSIRATLSPSRARLEKAHLRARREILEAAAGVFAHRGYAASTLADLAKAAGYAAPSLYRYFASKEEIFRSLVELMKVELRATFDAPVRATDPLATRLESLLSAQLELARRRRDLFALLLTTRAAALGEPPVADLRAGASLYEKLMADWMRRHVASGELRRPLEEAARALAAIAHAFHHAFVLGPDPGLEPAAEAHRVVDLVVHGIAATPAPGPPAARRGATP